MSNYMEGFMSNTVDMAAMGMTQNMMMDTNSQPVHDPSLLETPRSDVPPPNTPGTTGTGPSTTLRPIKISIEFSEGGEGQQQSENTNVVIIDPTLTTGQQQPADGNIVMIDSIEALNNVNVENAVIATSASSSNYSSRRQSNTASTRKESTNNTNTNSNNNNNANSNNTNNEEGRGPEAESSLKNTMVTFAPELGMASTADGASSVLSSNDSFTQIVPLKSDNSERIESGLSDDRSNSSGKKRYIRLEGNQSLPNSKVAAMQVGSEVFENITDRVLKIIPTFVPEYVRRYFAEHDALPTGPISEEKFGAVVMADVSGYSTLASKLGERGPVGAEILSKTMNGYLDKAVQIVLAHGGDIIKFAGDAIVFCWRTNNEDQNVRGEYVLQACECCLELLKKLGNYPTNIPDCDITHLNVHLGVGAGTMYDVHVGGSPGRWEHFIAGESINQLAIVLDLAKPGQLAVSHFALKYLSRVVDVASLQLGSYDKRCIILNALENKKRIQPPIQLTINEPLIDDSIAKARLYQQYFSTSGVHRILSGGAESLLLNEYRRITTIFIKVKSITFKTDSCLENSQAALCALQKALVKYEGTLRQFIVDDKGSVILSYFGLPPYAHEYDPMIAVKAALEVRNRMRPIFDHGFAIGVATGQTYVGMIGNSQRADYTVTGDSVNMAARLMSNEKAKGDILVDEETYQNAKDHLDFEALGSIKVKGKSHPIAIYRPIRSRVVNSASIKAEILSAPIKDFVNRDKEKADFERLMEDFLAGGKKRIAFLESETMLALSSFCQHVAKRGAEKDFLVLNAVASETERSTPFWSFKPVIEETMNYLSTVSGMVPTQSSPNMLTIDPTGMSTNGSGISSNTSNSSNNIMGAPGGGGAGAARRPSIVQRRGSIMKLNETDGNAGVVLKPRRSSIMTSSGFADFEKKVVQGLSKVGLASEASIMNLFFANPLLSNVSLAEDDNSYSQKITRFIELVLQLLMHVSEGASSTSNTNIYGSSTSSTATATGGRKCMIIGQNFHWADNNTWDLVANIVQYCPNVFVVVASRPSQEFFDARSATIATRLMKDVNNTACLITFRAMNQEEVKEMIRHVIKDPDAIIHDKIVSVIWERAGGNYVFTQNLINVLLASERMAVVDGELVLRGPDAAKDSNDLSALLPLDLKSAIVSQMDKLDQTFQLILRIAAVLGVHFNLRDVLSFASQLDEKMGYVKSKISQWDRFRFLRQIKEQTPSSSGGVDDDPNNNNNNNGTSNANTSVRTSSTQNNPSSMNNAASNASNLLLAVLNNYPKKKSSLSYSFSRDDTEINNNNNSESYREDEEGEDDNLDYCFVSSAIRDCIYSTILVNQREQYHRMIYQHLETHELASEEECNRPVVLRKMYEHSRNTNDLSEQLRILERLCRECFALGYLEDSLDYYKILLGYADAVESAPTKNAKAAVENNNAVPAVAAPEEPSTSLAPSAASNRKVSNSVRQALIKEISLSRKTCWLREYAEVCAANGNQAEALQLLERALTGLHVTIVPEGKKRKKRGTSGKSSGAAKEASCFSGLFSCFSARPSSGGEDKKGDATNAAAASEKEEQAPVNVEELMQTPEYQKEHALVIKTVLTTLIGCSPCSKVGNGAPNFVASSTNIGVVSTNKKAAPITPSNADVFSLQEVIEHARVGLVGRDPRLDSMLAYAAFYRGDVELGRKILGELAIPTEGNDIHIWSEVKEYLCLAYFADGQLKNFRRIYGLESSTDNNNNNNNNGLSAHLLQKSLFTKWVNFTLLKSVLELANGKFVEVRESGYELIRKSVPASDSSMAGLGRLLLASAWLSQANSSANSYEAEAKAAIDEVSRGFDPAAISLTESLLSSALNTELALRQGTATPDKLEEALKQGNNLLTRITGPNQGAIVALFHYARCVDFISRKKTSVPGDVLKTLLESGRQALSLQTMYRSVGPIADYYDLLLLLQIQSSSSGSADTPPPADQFNKIWNKCVEADSAASSSGELDDQCIHFGGCLAKSLCYWAKSLAPETKTADLSSSVKSKLENIGVNDDTFLPLP